MKEITRRLRMFRAGVGLSQRDVAGRSGIPVGRYWEIENGYRAPSDAELARIARAVRVQPEEIRPEAIAS